MKRPLKIAYLDYSHVFAGAEQVLYTLISNIDRSKFEPVIVFPYPQDHHKRYTDLGCEIFYLSPCKKWWMGSDRWKNPLRGSDFIARSIFGVKLKNLLIKIHADILHVNLLRPDCLMWIAPTNSAGIKIIGHFRSQELAWVPPSKVQNKCDLILCVSEYSRKRLLSKGEYAPSQVLYDSINISKFDLHLSKEESRMALGLPTDGQIICSVGQLSNHKGHDNAIRAFASIAKRFPKARLFIAGDGVEKAGLHDLAESFPDVSGRIIFTDKQVENISAVYSASDLTLSLTKAGEAFGLVPYESALHGTPFVAPEFGAITEFVVDGENGLLVDTNNVDAISSKMMWALEHVSETNRMVESLQKTINDCLTPSVMTGHLESVYTSLLS